MPEMKSPLSSVFGFAHRISWISLTVFLFLVFSLPRAASGELLAGTAKVNITPPVGIHHYGFLGRPKPYNPPMNLIGAGRWDIENVGVHDSIYARVLALSDGKTEFTIVSLDLIAFFPEKVRTLLPASLQNVLFCSTHNHAGPAVVNFIPPVTAYRTPYLDKIEADIARAIIAAHAKMKPAAIHAGKGTVNLSYNKLGGGKGLYLCGSTNPDRIPFEPVDKEVGVIHIDDANGRPVAVLVNYASHPVVYWPGNLVTGEYPGHCARSVETALGNNAVCLFVNGACGDVDPFDSCLPSVEAPVRVGRSLADTVLAVHARLGKNMQHPSKIAIHTETLVFQGRKEMAGKTMNAELNAAVIGDSIAFVTGPGEFYMDFQLDLKKRSPVANTFFFGYTNGYMGYFPSKRAWDENWGRGIYEHYKWAEIGAGEKFIDRAVAVISTMVFNRADVR
jgi:neutral ceramidase